MARAVNPKDMGAIITDNEVDVGAYAARAVDEDASKVAVTIIMAGE